MVGVDGSDRDPLVLDAAIDAATRANLELTRTVSGERAGAPTPILWGGQTRVVRGDDIGTVVTSD